MNLDYLETHLTDHCNLNCSGCGHFSPLSQPIFSKFDRFKIDLNRLKDLFENIATIRLMGGEPLLHPSILDFIEFTRSVFPKARITIVTNGILLLKQPNQFWEKCSQYRIVIQITKYPIFLDHDLIEKKRSKFNVKIETSATIEYFYRGLNISGDSDPNVAFQYCQSQFKCPFLKNGKIYICAFPALVHIFNHYFSKNICVTESDFIDIHQSIQGQDYNIFYK